MDSQSLVLSSSDINHSNNQRKRKTNPMDWIDKKAKLRRNSGEPYVVLQKDEDGNRKMRPGKVAPSGVCLLTLLHYAQKRLEMIPF